MPKMKTHKGAARRFRKTAKGKFKTTSPFADHIKTKKSAKRKRNLRKDGIASKPDTKRLRKLLP
ncbi:MAG: 50S ribosomal protein L35 [Candidatus Fermentibacteraceae bacterium]|nr:50S ribosomal protein L35 [Candidatus Fermentibacteraceae bacterium]